MDIYVIAPVRNLDLMNLGNRIFVLAHLWVKYESYREFILARRAERNSFLTLDNSAAERSLVTEDVLIDITKQLMPDEVIAPDVLFDKEKTIANAKSFYKRMKKEGLLPQFDKEGQKTGGVDIFFCPQGGTKEEWLEAYQFGLDQDWINVIGLSKIAVPKAWLGESKDDQSIMEARHKAYKYLKSKNMLEKPIHCLGQGDPREFDLYDHPMMRSTDSVFPVLAADHDVKFYDVIWDEFERIPTPHDYLEKAVIAKEKYMLVRDNVNFLKRSCQKK